MYGSSRLKEIRCGDHSSCDGAIAQNRSAPSPKFVAGRLDDFFVAHFSLPKFPLTSYTTDPHRTTHLSGKKPHLPKYCQNHDSLSCFSISPMHMVYTNNSGAGCDCRAARQCLQCLHQPSVFHYKTQCRNLYWRCKEDVEMSRARGLGW